MCENDEKVWSLEVWDIINHRLFLMRVAGFAGNWVPVYHRAQALFNNKLHTEKPWMGIKPMTLLL